MDRYNMTRYTDELLEEHVSDPPSFTVRLYPEYWILNGGPKFLYNNQVASLLDDIQAQRIPNDFLELFDLAKVPFYDGCMIVELLDYRPPKAKAPQLEQPQTKKVVLAPNAETLWSEICLMNEKNGGIWTDKEALEFESKILLATAPPLCLDPDPHLARIANSVARVCAPAPPVSLKRKAAVMEEEEEIERARRAKITQYMNPRAKPLVASYRILDTLQRIKAQRAQAAAQGASATATAAHPAPAPVPTPVPMSVNAQSPSVAGYAVPVQPPAPALVQPARLAPTPVPRPSVPLSTPTPPVRAPTASPEARKRIKRSESSQSPLMNRPSSVLPAGIPSHMQTYQTQAGRNTPVPLVHTSRPPSAATVASSPIVADKRPASAMQMAQVHPTPRLQHTQPSQSPQQQQQPPPHQQPPQPPHLRPPQLVQASGTQQPRPNPPFQQNAAAASLLAQAQAKAKASGSQALPAHQPHQPMIYGVYPSPLVARRDLTAQARGSDTPVPGQAMANTSAAAAVQRGSPMVAAQSPMVSRSPMPNAQQQQPQQPHLGHPQQSYNFAAAMQNMNFAQHPHFIQHAIVNGAAQGHTTAGGQQVQRPQNVHDQAQAQQAAVMATASHYPHMFAGYAQMPQRQVPPAYWPMGMGRGMPVVNGQHQMSGIASHPQQMPLGAGRTIPGGMQGS